MERIQYQEVPQEVYQKLRAIENSIESSSIDRKLKELVRLRTAQLNGCAYCVDMHYKELKHRDETELRLSSLCVWEETPYFSEEERAVLHFTDALTQLNGKPISDTIYQPLTQFFNKEEIIFLSLAIAQSNTWNRLMKVFKFTPGYYKVNQFTK